MHSNYLSVSFKLYCDMSQALYTHLQTLHVQSQTIYNPTLPHFKYNIK